VHGVSNAPAYRALNPRIVEGIQKKIAEKCRRNLPSRLLNAKNDKETIATWKLDLNRILHIFNVCPVVAARILLTIHLQMELVITTHVIVSDVHHDVLNTRVMVSEIHSTVVKGQEGTYNQRRSVSDICTLFHQQINKRSPLPRRKQGQQP